MCLSFSKWFGLILATRACVIKQQMALIGRKSAESWQQENAGLWLDVNKNTHFLLQMPKWVKSLQGTESLDLYECLFIYLSVFLE